MITNMIRDNTCGLLYTSEMFRITIVDRPHVINSWTQTVNYCQNQAKRTIGNANRSLMGA